MKLDERTTNQMAFGLIALIVLYLAQDVIFLGLTLAGAVFVCQLLKR